MYKLLQIDRIISIQSFLYNEIMIARIFIIFVQKRILLIDIHLLYQSEEKLKSKKCLQIKLDNHIHGQSVSPFQK